MIRVFVLVAILIAAPVVARAAVDPPDRPKLGETLETGEQPVEADRVTIEEAVPHSLEGPVDPDTYVLGPSDEILLILRGPETQSLQLEVLPEGNVVLPNVGVFGAAGSTLTEFRDGVRKALGRYYRNVTIECQLSKPRTFVVFVLGEVNRPGPVEMFATFRVSHAVSLAGRARGQGSQRQIEIREKGKTVRFVDLFAFFELGDFEQNPRLKEGQSVYVPLRQMRVQIQGEVRKKGHYEIVRGETVADVIRFAGGFTTRADRETVIVERVGSGSEISTTVVPLAEADQFELQDTDVVVVGDVMSLEGIDPVQVVGGGGRGGALYVNESERLGDFLPRLASFSERFNVEHAVLERTDSVTTEYRRFNVRDALAGGPDADMMVLPGDIITFPVVDQFVFVTGEVVEPGGVSFQPGAPAERYIGLAGGPTDAGSYNKLDILTPDGTKRDGDRTTVVHRGETIVVERKTSRILGGLFVGVTSLTALTISIIAVTK